MRTKCGGGTSMIQKVISTALFISFVAVTGYAANSDNATPLPGENKSSPSSNPSYFEGFWVGSWPNYSNASASQDVNITIDRGDKEGIFLVTYAWGSVNFANRTVPAGSIKTKGSEQGDKFFFKWKNKQGRDIDVILQKYKENVVKARYERSGSLERWERPYNETYLNRK